jgi:prepilin-type N-terminal cleavage/methylation domain-containing protein
MKRYAFTLMEMLIVVAVIAILAALALAVYFAAARQAKVHRTRAIVAKLDGIIGEKWESYRTRQLPIKIPDAKGLDRAWGVAGVDDDGNGKVDDISEAYWPGSDDHVMQPTGEAFTDTLADDNLTNGFRDNGEPFIDLPPLNGRYDLGAAEYKLLAVRELQRLELPNLKADVLVDPLLLSAVPIFPRPSLSKQYLRRAQNATGPALAGWTEQYEGAECLFLIVAATRDGDTNALDWFSKTEIGDVDGDGMKEILDAWGQPVEFVRWPLGYSEGPGPDGQWGVAGTDDDGDGIVDNETEAAWLGSDDKAKPVTPQSRNPYAAGSDPFDNFGVDGRTRRYNVFVVPVTLKPLVYSAGPDKRYSIRKLALGNPTALQLLDPYRVEFTSGKLSAGSPFDPDGLDGWADNVTNHDLEAK